MASRLIPLGLLLPLILTACSQRQSAPTTSGFERDIPIAGIYQYQTVLDRSGATGAAGGMLVENVSGTIRLEGSDGRYSGEITATGRSPMTVTSVTGDEEEIIVQARGSDGGPVTLRLIFQGDSFSGQWTTSEGISSPIRGVRRQ